MRGHATTLAMTVAVATLLSAAPALAQPVPVADCTADVTVHEPLALDVLYRCHNDQPISFESAGGRAAQYMRDAPSARIAPVNGIAETRYRFDLSGFARAVNSPVDGIQRGKGVLAPLGAWLLEPRGYSRHTFGCANVYSPGRSAQTR